MTRDDDVAELQQAVARLEAESGAHWREQWNHNEKSSESRKAIDARLMVVERLIAEQTGASRAMAKAIENQRWWILAGIAAVGAIAKFI